MKTAISSASPQSLNSIGYRFKESQSATEILRTFEAYKVGVLLYMCAYVKREVKIGAK